MERRCQLSKIRPRFLPVSVWGAISMIARRQSATEQCENLRGKPISTPGNPRAYRSSERSVTPPSWMEPKSSIQGRGSRCRRPAPNRRAQATIVVIAVASADERILFTAPARRSTSLRAIVSLLNCCRRAMTAAQIFCSEPSDRRRCTGDGKLGSGQTRTACPT